MTGPDDDFRQKLLATFREEADEYLEVITQGLIESEKAGPGAAPDLVEQVYRKVHSLKGAARAVQLKEIGMICQNLENVFSSIKQGIYFPDEVAYDIFHRTIKAIKKMLSGRETHDVPCTEIIRAIQESDRGKKKYREESLARKRIHHHVYRRCPNFTSLCQARRLAVRRKVLPENRENVSVPAITSVTSEDLSGSYPGGEKNALSYSRIDAESTIRISTSRLDRLITGSDDLLTTRLFITHRSRELEEMMTRVALLAVEPDAGIIRPAPDP